MMRTIYVAGIIALIAAMMITPASATTWNVYEGESIQAALDIAADGDTVFVHAGTYTESSGLCIEDPNITLKGEGADSVTVDLTGDRISLSIDAYGTIIEGLRIINSDFGVMENAGAHSTTVRSCVFEGLSEGIMIQLSNYTFRDNVVLNATGVYGPLMVGNDYGTIVNNTIKECVGPAVSLTIWIDTNENNIITRNNLISNDAGIELYDAGESNKIYLNNFVDNGVTATTSGTTPPAVTYWNSTEPIDYTYGGNTYTNYLGNYWSDYGGTDGDGDGIGDSNYVVPDSLGNDFRPLMAPFENYLGEEAAQSDLTPTSLAINPDCTSVDDQLFVNESNELCATIENTGAGDAAAFDVCFTADGVSIGCASVTGLPAGENTTVCIDWTPDCTYNPASRGTGTPVTINVTADCTCAECPACTPGSCGVIDEEDEYNNTLSLETAVYENGYKSKNVACGNTPLELHTYTEMYGGVVYNVSGEKDWKFEPAETDTRVHTITVPPGMTVKEARLYVYGYDYFYNPPPGYLPDLEVTVAGITHTAPDASYNDQKGFGSYNTPKWTYAYDVTSQITGSGDYTVSIENTGPNNTALLGEMLVVIYEDPGMNPDNWMKLWMLEGCDLLKSDASYCVSTDESTATVTFPGAINTPSLASAELITVVAQGQESGANKLINGATVATDVWSEITDSKINVDVEDVTTLLAASDNTLGFEDNGTKGLQASNAILVAREGAAKNRVYLSPMHSSASYGNTTTVEVYADTTDNFQGGQFYLEYPDGCAEITDVTFDSMWPYTTKNLVDYPGALFATFRKDPPMVNGTQHIATLTIACNNSSYCTGDLHFALAGETPSGKDSKLYDDVGTPLADIAWHDGTFTCMNLPDLVITEVYGVQTTGDDYVVHYTVENQGNAAAAADHDTTLYIDDVMIEHKSVPVALAPGESYTGTFTTNLTMTPPNDLVKACADNYGEVMELDEYNNCLENYYPAGIELKVDVLDDGECVDSQEQFLVNITVDPRNIPVYGVQYVLSFDNSVLHCEWQNEGTFLSSDGADTNVYINTIDNGAGTISFAATRTGVEFGVKDPGTLATIKFTAIQQGGNSSLNLSDVVAANGDGNEIDPLDLINDTVCVSSNMPPVAIGKSMHKYNNDGQKYLCKVYFNGTESYDPDGSLVSWRWNFGDGNYGTGELVDHVYQSWNWNGTGYDPFKASLTVTDDGEPGQLDNTTGFDVIVYTAGDANGDGKVNILDATIVGLEWGNTTDCSGAYCWEGNDRGSKADLNNDNKVNILDAVIIGTCWGHTAW